MNRRDCCKKKDNLDPVHQSTSADTRTVVLQCSVCERKHYKSQARAKSFGVEGADA